MTWVFLFAAGQLPGGLLGDRALVVLEATRVIGGLGLFLYWLGWAVSDLVLPIEWREYELLLLPLIGLCVLIPAAYFLNFFLDMRAATAVMAAGVAPLGLHRLMHGRPVARWTRELAVPATSGFLLLFVALIPHVIQGSLGLLSQSMDEETYHGLAKYLLAYPAGSDMPGPPVLVSYLGTSYGRTEGYGFQYLLASGSAVAGVEPFDAYLPVVYLLLGLGASTWYILYRRVLLLTPAASQIGTALFALHGLPLWIASYGYARQTAWVTLTPLAISALAVVLQGGSRRAITLSSLVIGSLLATETRVFTTQVAVTAVGLAVFWAAVDRRFSTAKRLVTVGLLSGIVAAPAVWHFVNSMIVMGGAGSLLRDQALMADWGPGLGDYPSMAVALGLESNVLVRINEPMESLAWMGSFSAWMSTTAPYLSYLLLLAAGTGAFRLAAHNPLAFAFVSPFFVWMAATRLVLSFPYGYFKLFGVAAPLLLGLAVAGVSTLGQRNWMSRSATRNVAQRGVLLLACSLFALFLLRNSAESFLFSARGWGMSIPPSLVRSVAEFGNTTALNSRIYITGATSYPLPEGRVVIRRNHRLGMQSKEEASETWSRRLHALAAFSLTGRQIYGDFGTLVWKPWTHLSPTADYDYYVLTSEEDPRVFGLDPSDSVAIAEGFVLFKSPGADRADSRKLLAARGTLRIDDGLPLSFEAGVNRLGFGPPSGLTATTESGRVRVGLISLTETTVDVSADGRHWSLLLDPGLSWYTTPTMSLPSPVKVEATGWNPVRVVSLRELPPGKESLERSNDSILSGETILDTTGVSIDVWFSNPAEDGEDVRANIGIPGSGIEERTVAIRPATGADRVILRFPLDGGKLQQPQSGVEAASLEHFPWLETGGGILHLRFRRGHEKPLDIPLASATMGEGKITELTPFVEPVQVRLWGYDQRLARLNPPDPIILEGSLVRADRPFVYTVAGGQRHWVPEPGVESPYSEPRILTPEQLWLIPPGLPVDR